MSHLEKAYALDVKIRTEVEKLPPDGAAVAVQEFANDGVIYERSGVRVIASRSTMAQLSSRPTGIASSMARGETPSKA
jgi:hypothetical protein